MIAPVPWYVHLVFSLTVLLTLIFFIASLRRKFQDFPKHIPFELVIWLIATGIAAYVGFFRDTSVFPPRLPLAVLIPFLFIALLFVFRLSRFRMFRLSQRPLVLLHSVRILVEVVLWWLYQSELIPKAMTFEGRNFDIIIGLTAPLIVYLVYEKKVLGYRSLMLWNVVGLALLVNIMTMAVMSFESPFQTMSFEMPNVAVTYFPFAWLPLFIVPVVFFTHVVCIVQLWRDGKPRT